MSEIAAATMRVAVERLQAVISAFPQVEQQTLHHHADGMYLRAVFSPKGTVLVGKVHRREHFYMVVSGVVQVTTADGVVEFNATRDGPQILTCPVGTKRAVYIREDAWRITVHRNIDGITDLGELENSLVEPDTTSMFLPGNKVKVLS